MAYTLTDFKCALNQCADRFDDPKHYDKSPLATIDRINTVLDDIGADFQVYRSGGSGLYFQLTTTTKTSPLKMLRVWRFPDGIRLAGSTVADWLRAIDALFVYDNINA